MLANDMDAAINHTESDFVRQRWSVTKTKTVKNSIKLTEKFTVLPLVYFRMFR